MKRTIVFVVVILNASLQNGQIIMLFKLFGMVSLVCILQYSGLLWLFNKKGSIVYFPSSMLFFSNLLIRQLLLFFRKYTSVSAWTFQTASDMGTSRLGVWGQVIQFFLYHMISFCMVTIVNLK